MSDTTGTPEPTTEPTETPAETPWEGKSPEELWGLNEKLRKENTTYKDRFRPYEEAFGRLPEEEARFFQNFGKAYTYGTDEQLAAFQDPLVKLFERLTPAQKAEVVETAEGASEAGMDPARIEKLVEERAAKMVDAKLGEYDRRQQQQRTEGEWVQKMGKHAEGLATKMGVAQFADPHSSLGQQLYFAARNLLANGESDPMAALDKAAQSIVDDIRKAGQELLKAKAADAGPSPAPADASGPSGAKKPKTMEDARASALERIERMMGGSLPGS